jgi:uncharacterized membrane protein
LTSVLSVLHFVSIIGAAIVAGGQVMVLCVVVPGMRRLAPAGGLRAHQEILDHRWHNYTQLPAGILSGVSAMLILVLGHDTPAAGAFLLLGLAGMLGSVVMTAAFAVPLNLRIRTLTADTAGMDYLKILSSWDRRHLIRTGFGLLSLLGFTLAAVVR